MSASACRDAIYRDFDKALTVNPSVDLRPYADRCPPDTADARRDLLVQMAGDQIVALVAAGLTARVEDYAARYPELTDDDLRGLAAQKQQADAHRLEESLAARSEVGHDPATSGDPDDRPPRVPGFRNWVRLGRGAMGAVWRAENTRLGQVEAVKVLGGAADGPAAWEALRAEARNAAGIIHPGVCRVLDCGVSPEGPYVRMELVSGPRLDEWARDTEARPRDIAPKMAMVASAVEAVHAAGVIHGDLKPANVLVRQGTDEPVVVDFGLATRLGRGAADNGRLVGTPGYMAPELFYGQQPTARTDVYALGAILHHLLTGRPPDTGMQRSTCTGPVQPVPADLWAIREKALASDPAQRYGTAAELRDDLERYNRREFVLANPPGWARQAGVLLAKHRWATVVAGLVLVTVLLSAAAAARGWRDRQRATVASRLAGIWQQTGALTHEDKDRIEVWLADLDELDPAGADAGWVQYVDRLLGQDRHDGRDVERLDAGIARLRGRGPTAQPPLRDQARWDRFRKAFATHTHSANFGYFLRSEAGRAARLERVVRIGDGLSTDPADPGARPMLLRAHMAAGDLAQAWAVAWELLDRQDLPPGWRILITRDLVWVAIGSPPAARADRLAAARRRVDANPELFELLVERARLHCADGELTLATAAVEEYFATAAREGVAHTFTSPRTIDRRLRNEPSETNLPALVYLDAALLRGVLAEYNRPGKQDGRALAEQVWAAGYEAVRGKRTGAYYEAGILASLSGRLGPDDVEGMMTHTAQDAAAPTAGFDALRDKARDPFTLVLAAPVLHGAWRSDRGRGFARQIATRELPFREFVSAHVRLWLFEAFYRAVGPHPSPERETLAEQFAWRLVEDLFEAYQDEGCHPGEWEGRLIALFEFAFHEGPTRPKEWPDRVAFLPREVRGALAYVLARFYRGPLALAVRARQPARINLSWNSKVIRPYLEHARAETLHAKPDSPLGPLVAADLLGLESVGRPSVSAR